MRKLLLLIVALIAAYFVLRLIQVEKLRQTRVRHTPPGQIQLTPLEAMPLTVQAQPPKPTGLPSPSPTLAPPKQTKKDETLTDDDKIRLKVIPPVLTEVRREVGKNPHVTPPTLIEFAANLGPKMDEALSSEPKARFLFGELEKCAVAGDKPSSQTAQALCLKDARRLETKFKSLHGDYDALEAKTPPEVVRLSKVLGE